MFRKQNPPPGSQPGTLAIPAHAPAPRIRAMIYSPELFEEHDVDKVCTLKDFLRDGSVTWIDVQGLGNEAVLTSIAELFRIHPLILEDIVNVPQRPKIENSQYHSCLICWMNRLVPEGGIDQEQVSIVVGRDFVLTFQERSGDVFDPVRSRLRQGGPIIRGSGSEYLTYALLDAVIDGYYPILETLGDALDTIEQTMLDSRKPRGLRRIYKLKRELLSLRRAVWPLREVTNTLLRDGTPFLSKKIQTHLQDCYDHCIQLIETIEVYRELSVSLMEVYLSMVANRQNEIMKTLTITATIFIPLTFVAGIYGMNFEYMPELSIAYAYPLLLAIMLVATMGMVGLFYRKGWIGDGINDEDATNL